MNTLTYKGYTGQCEVDTEAGVIFGEVIDINDGITFQSDTVVGIRAEFERSVDDYLKFCAEIGEEPAKPFSGRFLYRTSGERHRRMFLASRRVGKSLNAWLDETVASALHHDETRGHRTPPAAD